MFDVSVFEQITYLNKIGDAKNDIERSYKQYLCQSLFVPKLHLVILNLIAALIIFPIFIFLTFKRPFVKKREEVKCIGEFPNRELNTIPDELSRLMINNSVWTKNFSFQFSDWRYLFLLLKNYFISPFFVLKCGIKMAMYSHMIRLYHPSTFVVMSEFSCTSSFLTLYCRDHNIRHINIMHGEKLFFIRDSFFHFDKCYVWDEHYKNLFLKLFAEPTQFVVSKPQYLKINVGKYQNKESYSDFKYYLSVFSEQELLSIINSLKFATQCGKTVKYRPHPRYSDLSLLRKYVKDQDIENPKDVSIEESISNLEYAVGSYTTVLLQAYSVGKKIINDDVTYKEQYLKLKEMDYILINKGLPSLSQFQ